MAKKVVNDGITRISISIDEFYPGIELPKEFQAEDDIYPRFDIKISYQPGISVKVDAVNMSADISANMSMSGDFAFDAYKLVIEAFNEQFLNMHKKGEVVSEDVLRDLIHANRGLMRLIRMFFDLQYIYLKEVRLKKK